MKRVVERGVAWGVVERNPVTRDGVRPPKSESNDVRPFKSWEEVERLAGAISSHGHLVRFACATGLRPSEFIALRWSDVDERAGTTVVSISKAYTGGDSAHEPKTLSSRRTLSLTKVAADAVQVAARSASAADDELVFPNTVGGYINLDNWRKRVWQPALRDAGLEARPLYQMRHTFASLALAAGADVYWVSKCLGHSDIRITLRFYARLLPPVDHRNLEMLDVTWRA